MLGIGYEKKILLCGVINSTVVELVAEFYISGLFYPAYDVLSAISAGLGTRGGDMEAPEISITSGSQDPAVGPDIPAGPG
jgi:hypothetical protein